jgi:tripartite-type tricarboxylate transporter receptor subunit TctC
MRMKPTLGRLIVVALACAWASAVSAQQYPNRPIKLIVGLSPGGLADQMARLIGPGMSQMLGQPVVIENRVGATGALAARQVADAPPDGHTLMMVLDGTLILGAAFNPATNFDPVKDFTPITKVIETPLSLVANPSFPANDLAELLKLTAAPHTKPYFYGSAGIGSSGHLVGEYLKQLTGIRMEHVPYTGASDAIRDTMAGQISMMIASVGTSLSLVQSNKLKALAVTGKARVKQLPNVPAARESGLTKLKDFDVQAWAAVVGPPKLPPAIVEKVRNAILKALADPNIEPKLAAFSVSRATSTPQELEKQIVSEFAQWKQVISKANLRGK